MTSSDIPRADTDALASMQVFALGISNSPATYRLTAADALTIGNAVATFANALATTQNAATNTLANLAAKDDARAGAEQTYRRFATFINSNADISDADKIAIGVRPLKPERDPIGASGAITPTPDPGVTPPGGRGITLDRQ